LDKDNYLKNAELATEQNYNIIDGILNNTPSEEKPADKVTEPPAKRRSREREER
jgi:hypothetical protein